MPEHRDQFRIPNHDTSEYFQDIPRELSGRDSYPVGKARAHVAKTIESNIVGAEFEREEKAQHVLAARTQAITNRRQQRLDSVISLHEDRQEESTGRITRAFATAFSLLTGVKKPFSYSPKGVTERELIQLESEIGSRLFDRVPAGNRREFFCLDKDTWIWHEESIDVETGKQVALTTRYEIHENGVLKAQEGARYNFIEGKELDDLLVATQRYDEQVASEVYGQPLSSNKIAA